jgi:hypothetical protein
MVIKNLGQTAYRGIAITFPSNTDDLLEELPRYAYIATSQ